MLNKLKKALVGYSDGVPSQPSDTTYIVGPSSETDLRTGASCSELAASGTSPKIPSQMVYRRPHFLDLNAEEVQASADHLSRPIILPRNVSKLPQHSGYAEAVSAGKTDLNEDQARAEIIYLDRTDADLERNGTVLSDELQEVDAMESRRLSATYFAIFDGHAGTGAALLAANVLHTIFKEHLQSVLDLILARKALELDTILDDQNNLQEHISFLNKRTADFSLPSTQMDKTDEISSDDLVTGALEKSFYEMDSVIYRERKVYQGGCAAIVAVFFMGKLYVANAGDCRAVICKSGKPMAASVDFTPESERKRIQLLAHLQPSLLHNEFTHLEFAKRPIRKDIGKKIAYRDGWMTGWSVKTVVEDDLKFPVIYGEGKRAKLLATIGVTRGFGDHDLRVYDSSIFIKPFLTPIPQVQVFDVNDSSLCEYDVLVIGSDGLWDVTSNERAASIVHATLLTLESDNPKKYSLAAQDLLLNSRGSEEGRWNSVDDISVFVIPLQSPN